MKSIAELRQKIQRPRERVDTWYGRHVMRPMSIYLTYLFVKLGVSPNQATLISFAFGATGIFLLFQSHIGLGILFVNLWYLVDHVDGEIARLTNQTSVTGYFFDTVLNLLIAPLTFLALGWGLSDGNVPGFVWPLALIGSFGAMMLFAVPMCEDSILLSMIKKGWRLTAQKQTSSKGKVSMPLSRVVYTAIHTLVTFPYFLMFFTISYGLCSWLPEMQRQRTLYIFLSAYAVGISFIWISQIVYKVAVKKYDTLLERPSGSSNLSRDSQATYENQHCEEV